MMRRSFLRTVVLLAVLLWPATGQAQEAAPAIPDSVQPQARYDTDLLPPTFHQSRRDSVRAALPDDAVAFFFSAPQHTRENDVSYEYRQDSDLYYLTGTPEAGSVLVLAPGGITVDMETVTELLFVPPRTPYSRTWLGSRFGVEEAESVLGVQKAVSTERYEDIVGPLINDSTRATYYLALPDGAESGSDLTDQIDFFRQHAKLFAPHLSDGRLRQIADLMLTVDDPRLFARLHRAVTENYPAEAFAESGLQQAYQAFAQAESLDDWTAWRAENLSGYANGTTLRNVLTRLRMHKTDEELRLLQRAIDITAEAQRVAFRAIEPGMYEYEVEAIIEYVFKRNGAQYPGFPSIVGSGPNTTVLHYETNRRQMSAEDMVLMDIGAEYHGYTADITRTVPVDGTFSEEEKAIYDLVLEAQEVAIEATRAGNDFRAPHRAAQRVIANGLMELGLIETPRGIERFFMHGTSHYLGLYVHDVGDYGPLRPGQVITVEPGIYIRPADDIDPKWWNIGVRIEDDVLVTDGDPDVLSGDLARTTDAVEALMQESPDVPASSSMR